MALGEFGLIVKTLTNGRHIRHKHSPSQGEPPRDVNPNQH